MVAAQSIVSILRGNELPVTNTKHSIGQLPQAEITKTFRSNVGVVVDAILDYCIESSKFAGFSPL
jgi:hypothetical protein